MNELSPAAAWLADHHGVIPPPARAAALASRRPALLVRCGVLRDVHKGVFVLRGHHRNARTALRRDERGPSHRFCDRSDRRSAVRCAADAAHVVAALRGPSRAAPARRSRACTFARPRSCRPAHRSCATTESSSPDRPDWRSISPPTCVRSTTSRLFNNCWTTKRVVDRSELLADRQPVVPSRSRRQQALPGDVGASRRRSSGAVSSRGRPRRGAATARCARRASGTGGAWCRRRLSCTSTSALPPLRWGVELDIHPEHRSLEGHAGDARRYRSLHSSIGRSSQSASRHGRRRSIGRRAGDARITLDAGACRTTRVFPDGHVDRRHSVDRKHSGGWGQGPVAGGDGGAGRVRTGVRCRRRRWGGATVVGRLGRRRCDRRYDERRHRRCGRCRSWRAGR